MKGKEEEGDRNHGRKRRSIKPMTKMKKWGRSRTGQIIEKEKNIIEKRKNDAVINGSVDNDERFDEELLEDDVVLLNSFIASSYNRKRVKL